MQEVLYIHWWKGTQMSIFATKIFCFLLFLIDLMDLLLKKSMPTYERFVDGHILELSKQEKKRVMLLIGWPK